MVPRRLRRHAQGDGEHTNQSRFETSGEDGGGLAPDGGAQRSHSTQRLTRRRRNSSRLGRFRWTEAGQEHQKECFQAKCMGRSVDGSILVEHGENSRRCLLNLKSDRCGHAASIDRHNRRNSSWKP